MSHRRSGKVATFDVHAGLGTVVDSGGSSHMFHCTAISNGSRLIDEGADVTFDVLPGGPGRWEAFDVTPVRAN